MCWIKTFANDWTWKADGGAQVSDGGAQAPVGPSVATPLTSLDKIHLTRIDGCGTKNWGIWIAEPFVIVATLVELLCDSLYFWHTSASTILLFARPSGIRFPDRKDL